MGTANALDMYKNTKMIRAASLGCIRHRTDVKGSRWICHAIVHLGMWTLDSSFACRPARASLKNGSPKTVKVISKFLIYFCNFFGGGLLSRWGIRRQYRDESVTRVIYANQTVREREGATKQGQKEIWPFQGGRMQMTSYTRTLCAVVKNTPLSCFGKE